MNQSLIQPPYLKKGDTIKILATAGVIKNKKPIKKAVEVAQSWGLHVQVGDYIFDDNFHFAGSDERRLSEFQKALDNPSIKAIWCARGGYGTVRIIDAIDFSSLKKNPKWIIGFSDVTVLHSQLHIEGIESVHGMMGTSFIEENEARSTSASLLKNLLFGESLAYETSESKYNKTGNAKGQLVGGNLSILQNLVGTPSSIDTKNKILFIEDIGEYHYHIDRMLYGLKRNGYFDHCAGIIVGDFSNIKKNTTSFGKNIEEIILDITSEYNFPIAFNFPSGHEDLNSPLIMGREVKLKVSKKGASLKFMR